MKGGVLCTHAHGNESSGERVSTRNGGEASYQAFAGSLACRLDYDEREEWKRLVRVGGVDGHDVQHTRVCESADGGVHVGPVTPRLLATYTSYMYMW